MKNPIRLLLLLALLTTSAFAADAPPAAPAKPLAESEKKFVKDAFESILAETHLAALTRWGPLGDENTKKFNAKLETDLNKAYGELGTLAQQKKIELPKTDPSAKEKAELEKIKKDTKNFEKNYFKTLQKEAKKTAQLFDTAGKSVQDAELKAFVATWAPQFKTQSDETAKAEDEASKKK